MITIAKDLKVNEQIRVRQVRLIGAEGEQIGIIDTREAMNMAREKSLDLVMVSPQAVPPVCRLLDYGRFRYEQQQNEKENRKRARSQEVKAIKFRVKIDDNDFKTKTGHVRRFLNEGHKVKVTIMFRGRERTHPELGERILVRVAETLADVGAPEGNPSMMGMDMNMIMAPRPRRPPRRTRPTAPRATLVTRTWRLRPPRPPLPPKPRALRAPEPSLFPRLVCPCDRPVFCGDSGKATFWGCSAAILTATVG
ncbi:translation initiation factor IF-3 [Deinococcus radiodurans]|nr:translation initiation factor IF-3 [Deinococcus radiodurans]